MLFFLVLCTITTMFHYSNASHFIWWCICIIFFPLLLYSEENVLSPLLRCFKLHEKKKHIFVGKKNGKMKNKGKKNHWAIVRFWVKTCIAKKNEMLCWSQVNKISKRVNICFMWLQTIQLIHDIFATFTSRNLNHLGYTLGTWPLLVL